MHFCSGPPRAFALPAGETPDVVAVALHPSALVFARVSASLVTLWAASDLAMGGQRLLASCSRGRGESRTDTEPSTLAVDRHHVAKDEGCTGLRALWAVWLSGDRLAVVQKGATTAEFYAFEGLRALLEAAASPHTSSLHADGGDGALGPMIAGAEPPPTSQHASEEGQRPGASASKGDAANTILRGALVEEYNLNQDEAAKNDVATAASGIPGSRYLFVGMASGLITVVEVAPTGDNNGADSSWFGRSDSGTKIWKIDVLSHLMARVAEEDNGPEGDETNQAPPSESATPPSCYALSCASADPPAHVSSMYLVACFEGGKCFIMLLSPLVKSIEQLLSLVNTERGPDAPSCYGRCTMAKLDSNGSRLALGWSDGGVSLFQLALQRIQERNATARKPTNASSTPPAPVTLTLEPIRELSLAAWGYGREDVGGVTSLAWSDDSRSVAVGYELRGFSLFSTDGCRLMSSLPQHNQPRPEGMDAHSMKEACAFGVVDLLWTRDSFSLIVVPRGRQRVLSVPVTKHSQQGEEREGAEAITAEPLEPAQLYQEYSVELLKDEDGLCLSLSGAPGRCGVWVRSESSFTKRAKTGGIGPAEASGMIHGGDLLVGVNGDLEVVNLAFEDIIRVLKELPVDEKATLTFLRVNWDHVFSLAMDALASTEFMNANGIQLLDDEDLCIREFGLRQQALAGDCDTEERPPLLEFERRAKFHGWESMQGTPRFVAVHKYVKMLFALFPVWSPRHVLNVLCEHGNAVAEQRRNEHEQDVEGRRGSDVVVERVCVRERCHSAFAEFDFAKSVPLAGGKSSQLVLLERAAVRVVAAPVLDEPCALTSCASWNVPPEFASKCCPLRLVAVSTSGNQIAVAGQRGFCLLNLLTGKWRMFGNVNDEQDMTVFAMVWVDEDVIVVNFSRASESHRVLHLQAYPRNHLDEDSVLDQLEFTRRDYYDANGSLSDGGGATGSSHGPSASSTASTSSHANGEAPPSTDSHVDDSFFTMETDDSQTRLFCVSQRELWYFHVQLGGSIRSSDLRMTFRLKRQVPLPSRILGDAPRFARTRRAIADFAVLPRYLHISDGTNASGKQYRGGRHRTQSDNTDDEVDEGGWFLGIVNMLVGGEVPDQYAPEEVLPRFAFLDVSGDVMVWDPEDRSQRLLCSNVSKMARLLVSPAECAAWPTPCRLMFGLYGPEGMKIWLPLLDGVYMTPSRAFDVDERRLKTFLACHDPLRAKTYEIEFGTAPATAELYDQVVREYGIALEHFSFASATISSSTLEEGPFNLRGCVTTVDDPLAVDGMLRFDSDVKVTGVQRAFGLLVGLSQDVYVPSGVALPCYDVFARVQPVFHTLLCLLVQNAQLTWAAQVLAAVRTHFALSTPTQELFLHSMLEACFAKKCSEDKLRLAIDLLRPAPTTAASYTSDSAAPTVTSSLDSADIEEYCEIVAHVARKSEPSRLKMLFPAAGDPLDLMASCQQRSELRTAANFLLILDECSTASTSSNSLRAAGAASLVAQCVEHEEWALAQHVVRVAREWGGGGDDGEEPVKSMDEHLAVLARDNLARGEFERAARCVEELQAKLPPRETPPPLENEDAALAYERLTNVFIRSNKRRQLW